MGWPIVSADVKRLLVTLLVASFVLTACSSQPTTEQTTTVATVGDVETETAPGQDPESSSTETTPVTQPTTATTQSGESMSTTTTTFAITAPDLDEELSEFEELEGLLDELDALLADL